MLPGPIFRRELCAATRQAKPFVLRAVIGCVLAAVTLVIGLLVFGGEALWTGTTDPDRSWVFGAAAFLATASIELAFLAFLVPALVGGAIAEERERDTLPLLLLTRLRPVEIVVTKLAGRLVPASALIMTGVPFLVAAAWAAGLLAEAALVLALLVASSAFIGALSLMSSAGRDSAGAARAGATGLTMAWLMIPPMLTVVPASTGTLWGDLLVELKALAGLVAPSSPLSLATDRGWYFTPATDPLAGRVALMIGLQALLGTLALAAAASRLKARATNPNWMDPTRGYRPPCGDDPIYWREYELPLRLGGASLFVIRLRYLVILIKSALITLIYFAVTLVALAIPVAIAVLTVRLGAAAFGELWRYGYGPSGPFAARGEFNLLVRAATGLLALFPVSGLPALVTGRITAERDRKTWDVVLTTPLEGAEILRSKARAAARLIGRAAWALVPIWFLGVASGAVVLFGPLLAAVDLALAAWAAFALGAYLGVRSVKTNDANSRSAFCMLGYFALHTPLVAAALASPREWEGFRSWPLAAQGDVALIALTIPAATGLVAWLLTRRLLDHFDEWVGRPCRRAQKCPDEAIVAVRSAQDRELSRSEGQ
jgi:hypothetical protein